MKSQDVIVALKLAVSDRWLGYAQLSQDLGMSMSQIHTALRRLADSNLYEDENQLVRRHDLLRFLVNGLPYVFPARPKQITRGFPTAWASPSLAGSPLGAIVSDEPPPVWPHPEGTTKGVAVEPLHPSVFVAMKDPQLYGILSAIDALRIGRVRERQMAEQEIRKRVNNEPS